MTNKTYKEKGRVIYQRPEHTIVNCSMAYHVFFAVHIRKEAKTIKLLFRDRKSTSLNLGKAPSFWEERRVSLKHLQARPWNVIGQKS